MKPAESDLVLSPSDDPRALDLEERRLLLARMGGAQRTWIRRLGRLVEPPAPTADFPAFLLETPPFRELRDAVGDAEDPADLPMDVRDRLQWFVDGYRDYLRTTAGEELFTGADRPEALAAARR